MGWFGIEGFVELAAAATGAGADADADAEGVAVADVAPFTFAFVFETVFLVVAADEGAGDAGEGDILAGGVARGVLRLVALVSVGCIVGGRTPIEAAAPAVGDPARGRTGVGGSVEANASPE